MNPATPGTWYQPTCPPWCDRNHPAALIPDSMADDLTEALCLARLADEGVDHGHTLADDGHGFTVELSRWESHPDHVHDGPPRVVLAVHFPEEDRAATPAQLRTWARLLTDAADEAERLAPETADDERNPR